ncbi:MAG TPA: glycoside hydrolase family 18 protein [Solirubrobacteraceae bacterium]|jgi:hypothetical protein
MSNETFVNYWIGQEPTTTSPRLDQMPAYVDVVPLAFVGIDSDWQLDFGFLCTHNSPEVIQGWIKTVRANGAKVLFSILDEKLAEVPDPTAFAQNVARSAVEWGVDGVDLDYEGGNFNPNQTLLDVAQALRTELASALDAAPYLSAPIWSPWTEYPDVLKAFAAELDLVTTMDYTPWVGVSSTEQLFGQYAQIIGSPEKIAIGLSCMGPPDSGNFTPLGDVETLAAWEPQGGTKGGAMLYTFSYDVKTRPVGSGTSGTGYPDCTWTKTIEQYLP